MKNDRKQKLIDLGAESLADGLLELAIRLDAVDDLVERMIASPEENIQRFKKKLSRLKNSRRFVRWGESSQFASELEALLQDLKKGVSDPLTGVKLVASFYKTDKETFENCDDSNGHVGNVYRFDAKELFVKYASCCADKEKVATIILKLNENDDYGVRDALIDCASECLPEAIIRLMITELQKSSDREEDEYKKRHWLCLIESLARQIKDALLFEQTRIASWGTLSTAAYIDISRVYLESGDIQTALSWLEKISKEETYQAYERDQLLLDIYRQLGDDKKLTEILYRKFRSHHSIETLQKLLAIIGSNKRDKVVGEEMSSILDQKELNLSDVVFLIKLGKMNEAEKYLLDRTDQLNGEFYISLLSLAEMMEAEDRNFAASIIYRSLLDSILERGYAKAYPHGVRYLKKMDQLAGLISDWRKFEDYATYTKQLHQTHGRKRSFWSKYGVNFKLMKDQC